MRFSKKAVFRHGRLEQVSRDIHTLSPIVRFKVGGEFFFTSLLQFASSDVLSAQLESLEAGQDVYLGAHRLEDGTFWLHWLNVPEKFELAPHSPEKATSSAWGKALLWACVAVAGVVFGAVISWDAKTGGMNILGSVMLVGGIVGGILSFDNVVAAFGNSSEVSLAMHRGLENLRDSLARGHAWNVHGSISLPESAPLRVQNELPAGVSHCRIDQARVCENTITRPTGRGSVSVDFLVYDFVCGDEMVSWPVVDVCEEPLLPAFRRRHPPFLAKGDQVVVYCDDGTEELKGPINRVGMPSLKYKPVLELFNLTDRTAYWSETNHRQGMPLIYAGAGILVAGMVVLIGIMALFSIKEATFVAAAIAFFGLLAFGLCTGTVLMGVALLLLELVLAMSDDNPEAACGRKRWRDVVTVLGGKPFGSHPASPVWMRLYSVRIQLLLVLTAVSGVCLGFWIL